MKRIEDFSIYDLKKGSIVIDHFSYANSNHYLLIKYIETETNHSTKKTKKTFYVSVYDINFKYVKDDILSGEYFNNSVLSLIEFDSEDEEAKMRLLL